MNRISVGRIGGWLAALLLLSWASARGDEEVQLRWKFTPDTDYEVELVQTVDQTVWLANQPYQTKASMQIDSRWQVKSVDENGRAEVEQSIDRVRTSMQALGQDISIDTKKPYKLAAPESKQMAEIYYEMIGPAATLHMDTRGAIHDVDLTGNLKGIVNRLAGTALAQNLNEESLKAMISNPIATNLLPAGPVQVGNAWDRESELDVPLLGKQQITMLCKYLGVEQTDGRVLHKIAFQVDYSQRRDETAKTLQFDIKRQKTEGTAWFDNEAGYMAEMRATTSMSAEMKIEGQSMQQDATSEVVMRMKPPVAAAASSTKDDGKASAAEKE